MKNRLRALALVVVLAALLVACGSSPTSAPVAQPTTAPSGNEVTIANFAFDPASLTIKVGSTVTWTNQDSTAHTATSDAGDWDSGSLSKGQSFSHTFDQAGTFTYHCTFHPNMKGTIVVTQ